MTAERNPMGRGGWQNQNDNPRKVGAEDGVQHQTKYALPSIFIVCYPPRKRNGWDKWEVVGDESTSSHTSAFRPPLLLFFQPLPLSSDGPNRLPLPDSHPHGRKIILGGDKV